MRAHSKATPSYFVALPSERIDYAALLLGVVKQTDHENWAYFGEESSALAKDFLDYGYFSRLLMAKHPETFEEIPAGYVQLRILKKTAPQLLFNDFYHHAGLEGMDLWKKTSQLTPGLPVYIDVVAVKQDYQKNNRLLKLVPEAIQDAIEEITERTKSTFDIYAVGVTDGSRKMCRMLGMTQLSEVTRNEADLTHIRTLFHSNALRYKEGLKKMIHKQR